MRQINSKLMINSSVNKALKHGLWVLFFLFVLVFCSCSSQDFSIDEIEASIFESEGHNCLSFFVQTSLDEKENPLLFELIDPSNVVSFSFEPKVVDFEGNQWVGSSDLTMPLGHEVPTGEWTLKTTLLDGRIFENKILIN